jgi:glycosyltransferase involved in cell wall biosynthesis
MLLSIVISTFNRQALVIQTIDSALHFLKEIKSTEVIIVDDCSTDDTNLIIQGKYKELIFEGRIQFTQLQKNIGVSGAKNIGAGLAKGEWILFLDSDDLLIPESAFKLVEVLRKNTNRSLIFFRCIYLKNFSLVGPPHSSEYDLSLVEFLREGTPGECLPVVRKKSFQKYPYYTELRGCEGITYCDIIRYFGSALVLPLVVRKYRTDNLDRLSEGQVFRLRSCQLAKYNSLLLRHYYRELGMLSSTQVFLKMIYYSARCLCLKFG